MRKMVVMVLVLLLFSGICSGRDRYQSIGSTGKVKYSFDTQTITFLKVPASEKIDYNKIDVWIKSIYTEEGRSEYIKNREKQHQTIDGYEHVSYSVNHYQFDIKARTYNTLSVTDYSDNGSILDNRQCLEEGIMIIPESDSELWLEKIKKYVLRNQKTIAARSK